MNDWSYHHPSSGRESLIEQRLYISRPVIIGFRHRRWIVDLDVCEYSGLTRYIMGMLDEVEILEGEGLKEYITKLGGYAKNPDTGDEGLTLAGVLMFGQDTTLTTALPYYFVDYREKLSSDPEIRWTDRVCPDGRWQPNLYQFYCRIYPKLSQALPVPFKLDETRFNRIDETPAHKSLRESIVNTLCHCHWGMMEGIVIERYPDRLYFSDPGVMLISIDEFFEGGHSFCRNPALQTMFRLIGTGDKAGSGADVIRKGWNENGWPDPELNEHFGSYSDTYRLY